MSRYSYAGEFVNPVGTWRVASRPKPTEEDPEALEFFIEVFRSEEREVDGVRGTFQWWSPHTSGRVWSDEDAAYEWMEDAEEAYEEDYDQYLEENSLEIARAERYEAWKREY